MALEVLGERKRKEIELLESNYSLESCTEKADRQESEEKLSKVVSDRLDNLQNELLHECQRLESQEGAAVEKLERDVVSIREAIDREKKTIDVLGDNLLHTVAEEIRGVEELLSAEGKVREETEKTMLKIIDETTGKLQAQAQNNKREREECHESLLRVLEQTCASVEQSLTS